MDKRGTFSESDLASEPGLSSDPSRKGGGLCGRQAATRTIRRITSPPIAIPRIAALEIDTVQTRNGWF